MKKCILKFPYEMVRLLTVTHFSLQNNKMLDYSSSSNNNSPGGLQLTSVPCSSANPPCIPSELVMGASSPSHSVSLPSTKFSLKTDPSLGDRLRPGDQACVAASSQVNSSRYKTELCRPFEENGTCGYGDKCQFAHGMRELRSLCRHPKYKTELCRTFHTIGFCPAVGSLPPLSTPSPSPVRSLPACSPELGHTHLCVSARSGPHLPRPPPAFFSPHQRGPPDSLSDQEDTRAAWAAPPPLDRLSISNNEGV
uniref:mRNA decay activator protein ZFP36 n=1 Tax=Scophthalmus maximus TaxID=52904 RepID=A0A8D3DM08_SCOMX